MPSDLEFAPMNCVPKNIWTLIFVLPLLACDPIDEGAGSAQQEIVSNNAQEASGDDHDDHDDHEHGDEEEAPAEEAVLSAPQSVGAEVSDDIELVSANDIVANPESFAGRTIRVTGQVKGFCHHRRGWYAIDVPNADPPYVRIVTAPDFLVPPGIMNATATAVGTVEVTEVQGSRRSHYEREHELGPGTAEPGRTVRAVIRATGARFEPASE